MEATENFINIVMCRVITNEAVANIVVAFENLLGCYVKAFGNNDATMVSSECIRVPTCSLTVRQLRDECDARGILRNGLNVRLYFTI